MLCYLLYAMGHNSGLVLEYWLINRAPVLEFEILLYNFYVWEYGFGFNNFIKLIGITKKYYEPTKWYLTQVILFTLQILKTKSFQ